MCPSYFILLCQPQAILLMKGELANLISLSAHVSIVDSLSCIAPQCALCLSNTAQYFLSRGRALRPCLHGTGRIWNRSEIRPCKHMRTTEPDEFETP